MKTNQIMLREDNRFIQRTKDGYFNANALLESWNENNLQKKVMGNYQKLDSTKELIKYLKENGNEQPYKASRGKGGTWMCDVMFIDFAMWVSLEFKVKVLEYVRDGLIRSRHDAGDFNKEMNALILESYIEQHNAKPNPFVYINEANLIREIAGVGKKDRNEMTENELSLITQLQKFNSSSWKKGFGKEKRRNLLKFVADTFEITTNGK